MKSFVFAALAALVSVSAQAQSRTPSYRVRVLCGGEGKILSQNGGGLLLGRARLRFIESSVNGVRTLNDVQGIVVAGDLNPAEAYTGMFQFSSIPENLNYKPRRYQGYAQFPQFNAVRTRGRESGMWGQLVVESPMTGPTFQAHYIFQAGDHMGGTLHMSCQVVR